MASSRNILSGRIIFRLNVNKKGQVLKNKKLEFKT